jgi:preprotein translocase subunit YajC
MEEIFRYMFAGFGIGILTAFGIVWFFIFRPEEKKLEKLERKVRRDL